MRTRRQRRRAGACFSWAEYINVAPPGVVLFVGRSPIMKSLVVALVTAMSVAIVIQAQDRGAAPQPAGQGQARGRGFGRANTPTFPGPPAGMDQLPLDLFNSKNYYQDRAPWSDQRH